MIHHCFGIFCAEQIYSDMAMGKNAVHWWEFKIAGKRAAPIRIPCPSLLEIKKEAKVILQIKTNEHMMAMMKFKCGNVNIIITPNVKVSL